MLGPTGGDVPGYRGDVEKAERGTDALRWMFKFVQYFGAVFVRLLFVRPGVACTFTMHFTLN
jgi:hypothetical protein